MGLIRADFIAGTLATALARSKGACLPGALLLAPTQRGVHVPPAVNAVLYPAKSG